jgi:hypothetical protein
MRLPFRVALLVGAGWATMGAAHAQTRILDAGPHGPPMVMQAPTTYPDIEYRIRDTRDDGYLSAKEAQKKLDKVHELRIQEATWRADQDGALRLNQIRRLTKAYAAVEVGVCDIDEEPVNNRCN